MRRPFRSPFVLAGCLLALAVPAAAQGTPRSMAECERLKNDLAYNQCLAMFGPPARNVGGGDGATASASSNVPVASTATIPGIPAVEEPEVQEGRRSRRNRYSRRSGRMSAAFTVGTVDDGGSVAEAGSDAPRSRHRRRRR
jgi:hypothetical protein